MLIFSRLNLALCQSQSVSASLKSVVKKVRKCCFCEEWLRKFDWLRFLRVSAVARCCSSWVVVQEVGGSIPAFSFREGAAIAQRVEQVD